MLLYLAPLAKDVIWQAVVNSFSIQFNQKCNLPIHWIENVHKQLEKNNDQRQEMSPFQVYICFNSHLE